MDITARELLHWLRGLSEIDLDLPVKALVHDVPCTLKRVVLTKDEIIVNPMGTHLSDEDRNNIRSMAVHK